MKQSYNELSEERKKLQEQGRLPDWYSTAAWQMFKDKYLYKAKDTREQWERIAYTAAKHLPAEIQQKAFDKFFGMLWDQILSPSTPVQSNAGTDRGFVVSCQGSYFGDSIYDFYKTRLELAVHSKKGFGTSGYLGSVRHRGSKISVGGKAEGLLPLLEGVIKDATYVSQGGVRRGSFAGYLELDHQDFDEIVDHFHANPEDFNIGWNVSDQLAQDIWVNKTTDAKRRYKKAMAKLKMPKGRGYWMFPDKANRLTTPAIKNSGISIKASNLC
jgi:ribonucleoside-diphosphate reductase alpha chain